MLTECGETKLLHGRAEPDAGADRCQCRLLASSFAAEIAKRFFTPEAQLTNWLGHDFGRAPARPRVVGGAIALADGGRGRRRGGGRARPRTTGQPLELRLEAEFACASVLRARAL